MANPRKFSEKIALHNQKQAEETAAFERIMQECTVTRVMGPPQPRNVTHLQPQPHSFLRPYLSGSLPNVNQIATNPQMEIHHQAAFDEGKHTMRHPARLDSRMRPYAYSHRRHGMSLEMNRNRVGHLDGPPNFYPNTFLSPPHDTNWRSFTISRTNSDSALHQSVMHPNNQDAFNSHNPIHGQIRQGHGGGVFNSMDPSYKALLESKKFDHQLQNANRPKSCETTNVSLIPGEGASQIQTVSDGMSIPIAGSRNVPSAESSLNHNLSHVAAQMGKNTGSLPNLPALLNQTIPPGPHDYNEQHPSSQGMPSNNPSIYHQAQSLSNLPAAAAAAISSHYGAMSRNPASPVRTRRTTLNGPSPLSISSSDQTRRIKFSNASSPKQTVITDVNSPPIGGSSFANPYSGQPGPHAVSTSSIHHQQLSQQAVRGGNLRIDVSAASKVNHQQPSFHRGHPGATVTSPITSPTSPTSHCSQLSPVTSPRGNPSMNDPFYRQDAMQPLQHQFEQFHMVNETRNAQPSHQQYPGPSSLYGLSHNPNENCLDGTYHPGAPASHNTGGLHSAPAKLGLGLNHVNKIPDIILTGADDQQAVKNSGLFDFGSETSVDFFSAGDFKANIGIEELRMLDDTNIISDPSIEDAFHQNL